MPYHVVKQGDYLSKVARQFGFADWNTIWNDPQNAELKKKRQNPNILYPVDKLFVPEKEEKKEAGATEQRHKFKVKRKPLKLRLKLEDVDFKPLSNKKCVLHVDGEEFKLTSQANGLVEHDIPPTAQQARLFVEDDSPITLEVPIQIGHLDPIDTVAGQKARLNNLGYFAGPMDKEWVRVWGQTCLLTYRKPDDILLHGKKTEDRV